MSHCLEKMFNSIVASSYDFWYYCSLLETPYMDLQSFGFRFKEKENVIKRRSRKISGKRIAGIAKSV